jgi:hypothetical protein
MTKKIYGKSVHLARGREEGFGWSLSLRIHNKMKRFSGSFTFDGKLQKQRGEARIKDRDFFKARLGEKYLANKVLHHSWIENSAEYTKVVLLHKSEHPNGGIDVPRDRKAWIEKENWLNT